MTEFFHFITLLFRALFIIIGIFILYCVIAIKAQDYLAYRREKRIADENEKNEKIARDERQRIRELKKLRNRRANRGGKKRKK